MNLDTAEQEDRLTVLDKNGDRLFVIPADVSGFFRRYRNIVQAILVIFFLILPWTKINGQQTLWLNISERQFNIFGLIFWAHDGPLIFFVFAILTLGLAFVTSVWGRVWCGWACPQTVFIDGIFRRIEAWVEGSYIQRRRMLIEPLTAMQMLKKLLKWILYFLVSSVIAHSFIAYFSGAEPLLHMMAKPPQDNWNYFLLVTTITLLIAFNFGWFREQFCIIMCPYGRFQSVLMDKKTLNVMYDDQRSDCIDCKKCIQVCPTRIDIRKGLQMECIACTACIDACNTIMDKVKQPRNLISYRTLDRQKFKIFKGRSIVYLALIFVCTGALAYNVAYRSPLQVFILRGRDAPFQISTLNGSSERTITNHLKLDIHNQTFDEQHIKISLDPTFVNSKLITAQPVTKLRPGESKIIHIFVQFPESASKGSGQIKTNLNFASEHLNLQKELSLVGPY